jgi:two-component system chemotaxis response regulator CheY
MKLLIVDDSEIIRIAIENYLKNSDVEIVGQAGDGVEALEIFNEKKPDMVTMDITMPEMDGLTCMQEMLKINSDVKVIVITVHSKKDMAIKALQKGAKRFLKKPFNEKELIENIKKLMES